jgi:hypothetical protein
MNLEFSGFADSLYTKDVHTNFLFRHMDVFEPGGELEVTYHGWTDSSSSKFLAGNRRGKSAGQGLTSFPMKRATCRKHIRLLTHLPPFFISLNQDDSRRSP